jgi:hypothetical protein
MKEELQGKLVEILTSIQTAAGKASDFAMEQLPDIAQQYVAYGRAAHTMGAVLGVCMLAAAVLAFRRLSRPDFEGPAELFVFGGLLSGVSGLIVTGINTTSALLVWLAPKVWLLKEIATLIK